MSPDVRNRPAAAPIRFRGGFTLIELILAVAILSIGVTAFLNQVVNVTAHGADPMLQQQAHAIAQSYLEEVLGQPFCDPDFSTSCRSACTSSSACSTCNTAEGSRGAYDAVCDYDGLADSTGARDYTGAAVGGLGAYNISVAVDDSAVSLSGLSSGSGQIVEVTVTVTHDTQAAINDVLKAYKVNY